MATEDSSSLRDEILDSSQPNSEVVEIETKHGKRKVEVREASLGEEHQIERAAERAERNNVELSPYALWICCCLYHPPGHDDYGKRIFQFPEDAKEISDGGKTGYEAEYVFKEIFRVNGKLPEQEMEAKKKDLKKALNRLKENEK